MEVKSLFQISLEVREWWYLNFCHKALIYTKKGYFAGTVGVRRLLALFKKYDITTTWFIPGHSLETFPEECAMIRDAGHEIGLHGYSHENPQDMTIEQQEIVLAKTYKMITDFCGKVQILHISRSRC